MPIGSGLSAQLGFAKETVYGVSVTPNRFVPLLEESLTQEIERVESQAIIAGNRTRRSTQWAPGNITCGGDIGLELSDRGLLLIMESMFGARSTAGTAAPYTHTLTPGDLADDSLTVQVGRPDSGGTVQPFTYLGSQVASWELACSENEIATLGVTLAAREEKTDIALATAAIPADMKPLSYNHGVLNLAGAPTSNVKSGSISGDNALALDRRFFSAAGLIAQPIQNDDRSYTGSFTVEYTGNTNYTRYTAGTMVAFSWKFTLGAHSVEITGNVRFDGATPTVNGKGILEQDINVTFLGTTNDASTISAIVVSPDALP